MFSCATSDASGYVNIPGRRAGTAPYEFALAHDASPELPFLGSDESGERGHFAFVRIVQTKAMKQNKIGFVGADEMRSGIEAARLEPRGAGAGGTRSIQRRRFRPYEETPRRTRVAALSD